MQTLPIEPSTKVAALIKQYPELEDVLIALAPAFIKLKNPILRRSVAKVASLRQAAAVAQMPVNALVDRLRAAVGQPPMEKRAGDDSNSYFTPRPEWFDETKVVATISDTGEPDERVMPLVHLFERARQLEPLEILELVTAHLPAPGIDIMKQRGFLVWSTTDARSSCIRTYFRKT